MALSDLVPLGVSLPHRFAEAIPVEAVSNVATMAEHAGFRDLWVTENTLSAARNSFCLDPVVALTFAAHATTRIRLGVAVIVLPVHHPIHVAHQLSCLDYLSNGRVTAAVGLGRDFNYVEFQVDQGRRVRRFLEGVELMRSLWTADDVSYSGDFFNVSHVSMSPRPCQQPMPLWFGGAHPAALRRAARLADGWIGSGGQTLARFRTCASAVKEHLAAENRSAASFTISKRVFVAVDENYSVARAEAEKWFGSRERAAESGVFGRPADVAETLEGLVSAGATHLILNVVSRFEEQVVAVAEMAGLT